MEHERSLRPGLLVALLRQPRWVVANLVEVGAIALQFLALRRGSLLLVQTLLVSGLLFALPMGAALHRGRLRAGDWLGTVAVVVGLGVFVGVARPTAGHDEASALGWAAVLVLGCGLTVVLVLRAPRRPGPVRATYLGGACGVLFGVNAALAKATGHLMEQGVVHAARAWEPYALAVLGALGFLLSQSAFQAGPLAASLPTITVVDPLASTAFGTTILAERVATDRFGVTMELIAGAITVVGILMLTRRAEPTSPPRSR